MSTAIVTGASRGLGRALAAGLLSKGWAVVVDARDTGDLSDAVAELAGVAEAGGGKVTALAGDVSDAGHREALVGTARYLGGLDLLVNNASTLGASPLPSLLELPADVLRQVYEVNTVAPLALVQAAAPLLRESASPTVLNITSDASVEHYPTWGGYGSAKAALDHVGGTLAEEEPWLRIYTVDPGDMRTRMHQDAFPGEDISDRPLPETVVPLLLALIEGTLPSGRYRASKLASASEAPA